MSEPTFWADPVEFLDGSWGFWDESWACFTGGYPDEATARLKLARYCAYLKEEHVSTRLAEIGRRFDAGQSISRSEANLLLHSGEATPDQQRRLRAMLGRAGILDQRRRHTGAGIRTTQDPAEDRLRRRQNRGEALVFGPDGKPRGDYW